MEPESDDNDFLITPPSAKRKRGVDRVLAELQVGGTGCRSRSRVLDPESPWYIHDSTKHNSEECLDAPVEIPEDDRPPVGPQPTRSILDNRMLSDLVEKNCVCRFCQGELKLTFEHTVGIATFPKLICSTEDCTSAEGSSLPGTNFKPGQGKNKRVVQFAINLQFVLSFLASGDGGTEAAKLLGFLNLPNSTTMGGNTFNKVEKEMDQRIIDVANNLLDRQVYREVQETTAGTDFDFDEWKSAVQDQTKPYDLAKYPELSVTMDGAWNQRSSGKQYASKSGFAILVGTSTWMPIAFSQRSTFCRICSRHKSLYEDDEVPPHKCEINHEGSAGAMESAALLSMYHYLFDKYKIQLKHVVTDDDSTMRAKCRWANADYERHYGEIPMVPYVKGKNKGELHTRSDDGLLRYPIKEPRFLADPSHRKKTFRNRLYKAKGSRRSQAQENLIHEVDILRLTRNFAYMTRQLKDKPKEEWAVAGKAVLEHHFDNHTGCGDFCRRKKELAQGLKKDTKVYRSKERDKDLYDLLVPILGEFITIERLEEIAHGWHTNVNESFNNSSSYIAPKNRVFAGSQSLRARLSIALGIKLDGFDQFFRKVFQALGIEMEPGVWHYLKWTGDWKRQHRARTQTTEYKKKRQAKTNEKIKAYVEQLRQARKKNDLYRTGVAMDKEQVDICHPVTQSKEKSKRAMKTCKCGSDSHSRTSHQACPLNPRNSINKENRPFRHNIEMTDVGDIDDGYEQDALDTLDMNDDSEEMEEICQLILHADVEEDNDKKD